MFGLIKSVLTLVVLLAVVLGGLAYLPDEKTVELGTKAAGLAAKGFRGGKLFFQTFKDSIEEKKAAGELEPEDEG
jgi:hypothetical protein